MLTEKDVLILNEYVKNSENAIALISDYNEDNERLIFLKERFREVESMNRISEVCINNSTIMIFLADGNDVKSKLLEVIQSEIDALRNKIDAYELPEYISNK